jgi:hypothetical protein
MLFIIQKNIKRESIDPPSKVSNYLPQQHNGLNVVIAVVSVPAV